MAKTPAKRPHNYKKKLELDENVEFDDLFKVAIIISSQKSKQLLRRKNKGAVADPILKRVHKLVLCVDELEDGHHLL